jgi:DNA replication protein DnaC
MSDPKPIGPTIARVLQRHAAEIGSPEYARRLTEYEQALDRKQRESLAQLCDERGVPAEPGLRAVTCDPDPHVTAAMRRVQSSLEWRSKMPVVIGARQPLVLVLAGTPGGGKSTALAWAVANHSLKSRFTFARVVGSTPRNTFPANAQAWNDWTSSDLVAIDELGLEDSKDASDRIAALLCERYDNGRATLCAGNLDAQTFLARYGDNTRLISRIRAGQFRSGVPGGCAYWHELPDEDLRDPAQRAQFTLPEAAE